MKHKLLCSAPICADDVTKHYIWYPDEPVCNKRPFKRFQKIQKRIQRLMLAGKLKAIDGYFTADQLHAIKAVRSGIKGMNPNRTQIIDSLQLKGHDSGTNANLKYPKGMDVPFMV